MKHPMTYQEAIKERSRFSGEFNWELFDKLCSFPLKHSDYAWIMGCSVATLENKIAEKEGCVISEYVDKRRAAFRLDLLSKQITCAMQGNITMLIWLGKQYLGQTEKTELSATDIKPITLNYSLDNKDDKKKEDVA